MRNNTVLEGDKVNELVTDVEAEINSPCSNGKIIVLVEGDDDIRLYGKFFDNSKVILFPTGTCFYIVPILDSITPKHSDKIIGIKDSDFDKILNINYSNDNLFITDTHDAETLCISQCNINDIVYEYTGIHPIYDVKNILFNNMKWISALKLINYAYELGICFKGFKMRHIYDGENDIDINTCITEIKKHENNNSIHDFPDEQQLKISVSKFDINDHYQLHNGHDFINCLAIFINRKIKSNKVNTKDLCHNIRLLYTMENFRSSLLYKNISEWESKNNYSLFKS